MRTRDGKTHRRRPENEAFRLTLMHLRNELGCTQETLAAKIGVTARTLSNWENGYWLPPVKDRLHFVLALRDVPPEYVVAFSRHLGLADDPAHDAFLQPFRDAAGGADARAATDTARLRSIVDDAVGAAARSLAARPVDVKASLARVLDAAMALGATIAEVRAAVDE